MYYLHHNPNFGEIPKQQTNTIIRNLFPNVLNHDFIFYSTFDYLNDLMTSKQDYGVVSHVVSTMEYLMKISRNQTITLKDLKNTNDNNSFSLLSILKSYVSLMVMVPYAIMRDRMFIQLKEFVSILTEEARFSFIMEVIQNSYTESIVVLGIVLYKDALHESWMKEVYGQSENNKEHKKSLFFSTEFLDIVKKTLFNIKSPVYESFNTDLTFIDSEDKKSKPNVEKPESYLDTYDGFWKKFEILFQSLNLYSYLFLRDNKEKLLQIWNNNFNDDVERDFLYPLKAKIEYWKQYIQEKSKNEGHHHDHNHSTENPYNYIPDCPDFQLLMMENMIEQLFALRKDFNNSNE